MYDVYKFYAMYLMPLQLTVCQVVRFMVTSGLFAFGNTWVFAAGDRPMDVTKVQCIWTIINDPDGTSIGMISTVLYGDASAHRDGQVANLSAVWTQRGQQGDGFAQGDDLIPMGNDDTNDTRTFDEARAIARQARCSPADLELAAGHIFGENTEVPDTAIVTHMGGTAIEGAFEQANINIPDGTDPADATMRAVPFQIPRGHDTTDLHQEDD
jgi:hypothetical protein